MFQFLLIFIILLLSLGFCSFTKEFSLAGRKGKYAFVLCMFFLGILTAFRSPIVGNDTIEYIRIFQTCEDLLQEGTRFEIGYLYYNIAISHISDQYQFLFIVTALFIFTTYGLFIWKYSNRPKLALLFFFLLAFAGAINTMRQFIAICILLYSLHSIINHQIVRFIFFVILASLFHTTAFFFLIVFPLSYLHLNIKTILVFAGGGILVFFLFGDFLNIIFSYFTMYEHYTNGQYFEGETRIASIVKLAFSIIIFTLGYFAYSKYTTKDWKKSAEGKRYALLMIMELIAVVVDFLSLKVNLLDRLELYFTALSFVLISNFIQLFPTRSRGIVSAMLLTLFLAYSCVAMTLRPEWNRIYPIELSWEF